MRREVVAFKFPTDGNPDPFERLPSGQDARRDNYQLRIERTEAICDEIKRVCGSDESLAALLLAVAMRVVGYPSTPDEQALEDRPRAIGVRPT